MLEAIVKYKDQPLTVVDKLISAYELKAILKPIYKSRTLYKTMAGFKSITSYKLIINVGGNIQAIGIDNSIILIKILLLKDAISCPSRKIIIVKQT